MRADNLRHSDDGERAGASPFTPYAPQPRTRPPGRLTQLIALARNPIEGWTIDHFRLPVVIGPSVLGPCAVVSDPAAIRRVFLDNVANYEKDPLQLRVLRGLADKTAGDGLLTAQGDLWRRTRRTLAPLFAPRRIAALARPILARVEDRIDRWRVERSGAAPVMAIDREMTGLTYDILSATLFSDALAGDAEGFERELSALLDVIGSIHPFDVFNAPDWIPRFGTGRGRIARAWFEAACARLIAVRREEMARGVEPPDDLLLALMRASDPETGVGLSESEVVTNLTTLIAAGHETTARALAWTLSLLARAPHWQERCAREAMAAPDDPAQWIDDMPHIRAALEEAMRLFPPAPYLSRIAGAPDRLGDVDIPAGAIVIVAPWIVHRHQRLWNEPDVFDPQRFMPGARETIDRFAYIPFGAGPRVCIGASFAMLEASVALAALLRRVRFVALGPEPRPIHRITLRPAQPMMMRLEPRR